MKDDPPCSNTQGASASGTSPAPDQAAQDFELASVWETVKKDFQKGLSAEDAQILESIKVRGGVHLQGYALHGVALCTPTTHTL